MADGTGRSEIAVIFREHGTHRTARAVTVIRQGFDNDGDAARRIAFIAHVVIIRRVIARRLLDGAFDIVLRHIFRARLLNGQAQPGIHRGVRQSYLGGNRYLAAKFGEHLGAGRVSPALFVHNVLVC